MKTILLILLIGYNLSQAAPGDQSRRSAGKAKHVVVMVWDGMRPEFVTPQYTPTLYRLATNGVFFKNHHSAYPSSTEVNGAALRLAVTPTATGSSPTTFTIRK